MYTLKTEYEKRATAGTPPPFVTPRELLRHNGDAFLLWHRVFYDAPGAAWISTIRKEFGWSEDKMRRVINVLHSCRLACRVLKPQAFGKDTRIFYLLAFSEPVPEECELNSLYEERDLPVELYNIVMSAIKISKVSVFNEFQDEYDTAWNSSVSSDHMNIESDEEYPAKIRGRGEPYPAKIRGRVSEPGKSIQTTPLTLPLKIAGLTSIDKQREEASEDELLSPPPFFSFDLEMESKSISELRMVLKSSGLLSVAKKYPLKDILPHLGWDMLSTPEKESFLTWLFGLQGDRKVVWLLRYLACGAELGFVKKPLTTDPDTLKTRLRDAIGDIRRLKFDSLTTLLALDRQQTNRFSRNATEQAKRDYEDRLNLHKLTLEYVDNGREWAPGLAILPWLVQRWLSCKLTETQFSITDEESSLALREAASDLWWARVFLSPENDDMCLAILGLTQKEYNDDITDMQIFHTTALDTIGKWLIPLPQSQR